LLRCSHDAGRDAANVRQWELPHSIGGPLPKTNSRAGEGARAPARVLNNPAKPAAGRGFGRSCAERPALPYNGRMADAAKISPLEITCPCCQARLTVDPQLGVVLGHTEPLRAPKVDLDHVDRVLSEQARLREEKFRQSVEAERTKEEVLNRKFTEALKKTKDQPVEKPLRDFDLD
jgi:hypothetical protein